MEHSECFSARLDVRGAWRGVARGARSAGMALVVHHLENSRSQRLLWLLEELGLDYTLKRYARDPKTSLAPEELREVHPLGKSPVLEDDGVVVAESGAIIEHVLDAHGAGRMRPEPGTQEHNRHRFFLHYGEGSLMPPLLLRLIFQKVKAAKVPFFVKPIANGIVQKVEASFIGPQIALHFGFIEKELEGRDWFCGTEEPTGADAQMSFPLEAAGSRIDLGPYPNIRAFVARVHARPAYQRALERGGPYAYA